MKPAARPGELGVGDPRAPFESDAGEKARQISSASCTSLHKLPGPGQQHKVIQER
jgi:hypothetical protein